MASTNIGQMGYNPYQTQMQTANNPVRPLNVPPAKPQSQQNSALSHIPYQPDVLSLSTKPDKIQQNQNITGAEQNMIQANSALQAQMPAPNIQNGTQTENIMSEKENITEENINKNEEKTLPSLNVGVVDAPNNASLTPITDDINSRAGDIERSSMPEIQKNNSIIPISLGKKPINAGKLSAGLMFGSLGIVSLMLIPKGISKIIKLIKHK